MSGKAKTAEKGSRPAKQVARKVTRVLEFRKNDRGNLVPKLRWEREA